MQKAKTLFEERVKYYSRKLDVQQPTKIIIKKIKSRWSSLTKDDAVNLSVINNKSQFIPIACRLYSYLERFQSQYC